jgi:hypothetical protein
VREDRRAFRLSGELDLAGLRLRSEDGCLAGPLSSDDGRFALGLRRPDRGGDQLLRSPLRFDLLSKGLRLRRDLLCLGSRYLAVAFSADDDFLRLVLFDRRFL